MSIVVPCDCGRKLRVKEEHRGKKIRCPACENIFTIPGEERPRRADLQKERPPERARRPRPAPEKEEDTSVQKRRRRPRAEDDFNVPAVPSVAKKPRKRRRKIEEEDDGRAPMVMTGTILGGVAMMIGAAVWFVLGLQANRIFFYPPILFVMGIVAVVKGMLGFE